MKKFKKIEYLILGISFLGMGFYFFGSQMFTTEKSLVETKGLVENYKVYYDKVKDKYGAKTTRATLSILLFNDSKIYKLRKNIGGCSENNLTSKNIEKSKPLIHNGDTILKFNTEKSSCICYQYERIKKKIITGEKLSIFINENDLNDIEPFVYMIINHNNEKIYSIEESKKDTKFGFWTSITVGLFMFLLFLRVNYLKK